MNTQNIELTKILKDTQNTAIRIIAQLKKHQAYVEPYTKSAQKQFQTISDDNAARFKKVQIQLKAALDSFDSEVAPILEKCKGFPESIVRNMQALDQAKRRKR